MEVLFVTTELAPWVTSTGLGDLAHQLSKALRALGHKVTVVMPHSPAFEAAGVMLARRLTQLDVAFGDSAFACTVYDFRLSSQVELVLLHAAEFGAAGRAQSNTQSAESALAQLRFAAAAAAYAERCAAGGQALDVVHGLGSALAFLPAYVQDARTRIDAATGLRTVMTLPSWLTATDSAESPDPGSAGAGSSGALVSGVLSAAQLDTAGIRPDIAKHYASVHGGGGGAIQVALEVADRTVATSPRIAQLARSTPAGGTLAECSDRRGLVGIAAGVDYAQWNPAIDTSLPTRYDGEDVSARYRCKAAVLRELGITASPGAPLVVSLGGSGSGGGGDLAAQILPQLLQSSDAICVIANWDSARFGASLTAEQDAAANRAIVAELGELAAQRVVLLGSTSDALAHRLLAGADIVLSLARADAFEHAHLLAKRYGAAPVVLPRPSLLDAVVDCDAALESGTGFVADAATAPAVFGALQRAIAALTHPGFAALQRRIMRAEHSWERTARQYERVYARLA